MWTLLGVRSQQNNAASNNTDWQLSRDLAYRDSCYRGNTKGQKENKRRAKKKKEEEKEERGKKKKNGQRRRRGTKTTTTTTKTNRQTNKQIEK